MASWLSLHIFHNGDLDRLLTASVRPMIETLRAEGHISRWFFVRYWNGGPHLRLRLETNRQEMHDAVATSASRALSDYLAATGTAPADPAAYGVRAARSAGIETELAGRSGAQVEKIESLQPEGSVQIRPFALDPLRHGGPARAGQALDHFCVSSELALRVIRASLDRPAARHAIALHATAATTLGLHRAGHPVAAILDDLAHRLGALFHDAGRDHALDPLPPELTEIVDHLRDGLPVRSQTEFANQVIAAWSDEVTHLVGLDDGLATPAIAVDALHMFMNRIGLGNAEEAVIYEAVLRCFEATTGSCAISASAADAGCLTS